PQPSWALPWPCRQPADQGAEGSPAHKPGRCQWLRRPRRVQTVWLSSLRTPPLNPAARTNRVVDALKPPSPNPYERAKTLGARVLRWNPRSAHIGSKAAPAPYPFGSQRQGRAWQLCPVAGRRRTSPRAPNARILRGLETIADLVGPEALQPHQGLVQGLEILKRDLANRLQRQELALVEFLDGGTRLKALGRQTDPHGAAILVGALV